MSLGVPDCWLTAQSQYLSLLSGISGDRPHVLWDPGDKGPSPGKRRGRLNILVIYLRSKLCAVGQDYNTRFGSWGRRISNERLAWAT